MIRQVFMTLVLSSLALSLAAPAGARVGANQFVGVVEHVSTNNIKVRDPKSGQVLSFLLVPRFNSVFGNDGKSRQMSALTPGTPVTIYYDQKALGARHADRILINGSARAMKS